MESHTNITDCTFKRKQYIGQLCKSCLCCETMLRARDCYTLTGVSCHYTKLPHIHINQCHVKIAAVNMYRSVPVFSFLVRFIEIAEV